MPTKYPPLEEIFPTLKTNQTTEATKKNLKRDVRDDLSKRAVWFNDLELAGYHTIRDSKILCVFDRYDAVLAATDSGRTTNKGSALMAGLQTDLYLLFIRADEFDGTPCIGQEISVDGQKLYVAGYILYDGVFEVTLKAGVVR